MEVIILPNAAYVSQVGDIVLLEELVNQESLMLNPIESNIMRCPNLKCTEKMMAAIDAGLGSPVFNKLEAVMAQGALSIPASKCFEIGSGFSAVPVEQLSSVAFSQSTPNCKIPGAEIVMLLPMKHNPVHLRIRRHSEHFMERSVAHHQASKQG
ncbi:hypothetical protein MLD38_038092 [Melastoma candidum]|uniref:Uncharacterized protein n=1 Tax=Melastoma candidum TaxID=119954 RepID=A0ACB9KYI0_9MYRT|nr:hypothetical protein MLD38_038092 [Melastoma candidum]